MKGNNEQVTISLSTNNEEIEISAKSLITGTIIQCAKKRVQFDSQVKVHKHALILGDNPAVSDGVPLQLSWEAECTEVWNLRDDNQRRRQPSKLSSYVRKVIASDQSPRICLVQVREEIRAIQKSRRESAHPKISLYDIFFPSKAHFSSKNHYGRKAQKSHMFFARI